SPTSVAISENDRWVPRRGIFGPGLRPGISGISGSPTSVEDGRPRARWCRGSIPAYRDIAAATLSMPEIPDQLLAAPIGPDRIRASERQSAPVLQIDLVRWTVLPKTL